MQYEIIVGTANCATKPKPHKYWHVYQSNLNLKTAREIKRKTMAKPWHKDDAAMILPAGTYERIMSK